MEFFAWIIMFLSSVVMLSESEANSSELAFCHFVHNAEFYNGHLILLCNRY